MVCPELGDGETHLVVAARADTQLVYAPHHEGAKGGFVVELVDLLDVVLALRREKAHFRRQQLWRPTQMTRRIGVSGPDDVWRMPDSVFVGDLQRGQAFFDQEVEQSVAKLALEAQILAFVDPAFPILELDDHAAPPWRNAPPAWPIQRTEVCGDKGASRSMSMTRPTIMA